MAEYNFSTHLKDADEHCCPICNQFPGSVRLNGILDWEYQFPGEWSHFECFNCGIIHLKPFPNIEMLKRAYEIDYHGHTASIEKGVLYRILYSLSSKITNRLLRNFVSFGSYVLDIGCGNGEFSSRFLTLGASKVDGIDFSSSAVSLAQAKGVHATVGTFLEFDADEATYNVIVMNNYLEHTLLPHNEITKALTLLKPGGYLIGEIPNYSCPDRWLFGRYWGGNHAPRHTFHFVPKTLFKLLKNSGYTEISINQRINPSHLALSIQNWLQRYSTIKNNFRVVKGRSSYYPYLLLFCLPVNIISTFAGHSGLMWFSAKRGG